MKIGAIILSRFNSSRLPGKALMNVNGVPVLLIIVERLRRVLPDSSIVVATSNENTDDAIEQFCIQQSINYFRGSLDNVADRFYRASKHLNLDYSIRINGDNVFVDTIVLTEMIDLARMGRYDFISNVKGRTFPKGMSVEIVNTDYYSSLLPAISESESYREHVTSYLYEHDNGRHFYLYNNHVPEASGLQMALDTSEDLERTKRIIARFTDSHWKYNLKEIYSIWKQIEYEQTL
jgi:spore coat polysaccharide biosynthesis protein SpsF